MADLLASRAADYPRWFQDLIAKAELADNGPVRGTMVIRPTGYAIWERMQAGLDARIKAAGAQNAYFPLLIPQSYLSREADHVEGFSPELAVVTHGGGKELAEPVVIRPTSETVVGEYMAKWISSHRDLPLLLNQWANVVRWELRPRLFLRTSEFLWQEGHTAHATHDEARDYARMILHDVYAGFITQELAIPLVLGRKTPRERFAGATATHALEAMMGDGKALQMGTSHELGQNFSRAFGIGYSSAQGTQEFAWTTSWGTSTRMLGGLIMCHGDQHGLRLPPRIAPVQALVMAVTAEAGAAAARIQAALAESGVRVSVDSRTDLQFGRRAVDAELKGCPVRIEIGPRDVAAGTVTLARRLDRTKVPVPAQDAVRRVLALLEEDQQALYDQAHAVRESRTAEVATVDEAIEAAATGWAKLPWSAVGAEGEARANAHGVSVRCLTRPDGTVPAADDEPDLIAYLARAY